MANKKHLARLRQGVSAWNVWRQLNPEIEPDLIGADFRWANLGEANLSRANLCGANLTSADLSRGTLTQAQLREARLERAILESVDLRGADLSQTHLGRAYLCGANLSGADLSHARLFRVNRLAALIPRAHLPAGTAVGMSLRGANLLGAYFEEANLHQVDFHDAVIHKTIFSNVDLSTAQGLETAKHFGPSTIGIDTIYRSEGKIPEVFLRGAGVPDDFITYIKSRVGQPFEFYSCFISYSSKDQDFAERLHADLQSKGVRCWFAPKDLKIGEKFRADIEEAIRLSDKLLLVLSEHSLQSEWVETEVETAFEEAHQRKKVVLFPVRLDDTVMQTNQAWAAHIRRTRHIGDFRRWKADNEYQKGLSRLLRDLKAEAAVQQGNE